MVENSPKMPGGQIAFDVPVSVAFDYLADPRNRPEWQSSLSWVEMLDDGEPRVGMRWRDHTAVRLVPQMEITALEAHQLWVEKGRWRAIEAILMMEFEPTASGCIVDVRFQVRGRGLVAPVGWAATRAGVFAVRNDVRRAARILSERG